MKYLTHLFIVSLIFIYLPACLLAQSSHTSHGSEDANVVETSDDDLQWGSCPEFMPESCRISVLNGSPDKPDADIFFKMEGQSAIPEHTHTSAERMVLVAGELEVDYQGQSADVMTSGDYGYGPPELPHSATCVSESPCILFIAFEEPIDAFPVNDRN
jgi:hypothetical protein